jgi:hypothetical protein
MRRFAQSAWGKPPEPLGAEDDLSYWVSNVADSQVVSQRLLDPGSTMR